MYISQQPSAVHINWYDLEQVKARAKALKRDVVQLRSGRYTTPSDTAEALLNQGSKLVWSYRGGE